MPGGYAVPPLTKLPKYLGDYAVLRPLSKGLDRLRFAVRSEPQEHPRLYVVKLFPPVPDNTPEMERERYVPRLTRGLSHRNLVESYQIGEYESLHYLVMEYVLSVDLDFVLTHCRQDKQKIPLEVVLYTGREICRGLAFLHGFGADKLLHGRVAPSHVLMAYSGQVKLAHVHRLLKVGATTALQAHEQERVASYQAPELLDGRPVDQRADVFSVGAILWEAFAGQRFELGPGEDASRTIATEGRIPLTEFNPDVPEDVTDVISRALNTLPEDRFKTAVDLGRRLDALLEKHSPGAGGRVASDWLVGRFRDELRARRRIQQQLLAEKRAETSTHRVPDLPAGEERVSGDLIGQVLDQRYRIRSLLGEGGMGQVYEAEHVQLGKRLAVKVLHPLYSTEDEVVERFRREARAASSIGHPNIVNVTDSGTTPDGRAYFVMELLDGMELADVITQEGPLDYERAVDIAIQVCQALGAAHKVGIIHRDMKPENVYLTTVGARTDVVKILDFGIAKSARLERVRGGQLTEPGLAVGTPEYMAPEQAAGKPPDPRFDIYAVGGILYAVLSGRPPHRGGNVMEILTRKATRNPTPPRSYRPDIPVELERAIMLALSRNPERRPQTMEEFEYELRKSLQGRPNAVAHMLGISDAIAIAHPGEIHASDSDEVTSVDDRFISGEHGVADDRGSQTVDDIHVKLGPAGATGEELTSEWGFTGAADEPPIGRPPSTSSPHLDPAGPPPRSDTPDPGDDVLFDKNVTPTEIVQFEPAGHLAAPVDEMATTSVYVPTADVREAAARDRVERRQAGIVAGGLLGGVLLIAIALWALWPSPPPPPTFVSRPRAPMAATGGDDSDGTEPTPKAPIPVVGLRPRLPPPSAATQARFKQRALKRWVDYTWRAARDRRFLKPTRDCVRFGLKQIRALDPNHESIQKLEEYTARRLLIRARRERRRGRLEEAEKTLRGLLELDPESEKAHGELAQVLVARGRKALKADRVDEAEELAKAALKLDDKGVEPLLLGAEILEAREKWKEAQAAYRVVLKRDRRNRTARKALKRVRKKLRSHRRRRSRRRHHRRRH